VAFFGATQYGKYDDAYSMLCQQLRNRISRAEFAATKGAVVSSVIPYSGLDGTGPEEIPERGPLAGGSTTWVGVALARYHGPVSAPATVPMSTPEEHWRVTLRSEGGHWQICGLSPA
jgi:hypothetical protein